MIRSFLIGLATGQRSLTPLAIVSEAARRGRLDDGGAPRLLASPWVTAGVGALAAGELVGDKLPSAPDRIVPAGMAVRLVTGGLVGAALADRDRRYVGAALGVAGAVIGAHLGWRARMWALRRWGQTPTGLVEDALTAGAAGWLVASRARA
jgi:uncharacterized membrane protein